MESAADKVYREVTKSLSGENFAIASYAALCSLESLAVLLKGNLITTNSRINYNNGSMKNNSAYSGAIFEVGSGYGTITRLLLILFKCPIICYELDSTCVNKLQELKESLNLNDSKRLMIINNFSSLNYLGRQNRIDKDKNGSYNIYGIVIDGPILSRDLYKLIKKSPELKFVFIERYRLIQRAQVSFFLLKCGLQQQYLELRHNGRMSGAYFLTDVCTQTKFAQMLRALNDFILTTMHLYPKLIKNLIQSKGRNFKVGKFREDSGGITQRI